MEKTHTINGLVWFKNDLRLHDNEALCQAIAYCDSLVFVYTIESSLFTTQHYGFRKADILRFKFLEQSVQDLQENLEKVNGHLIITQNSAIVDLPKLVEQYGIAEKGRIFAIGKTTADAVEESMGRKAEFPDRPDNDSLIQFIKTRLNAEK